MNSGPTSRGYDEVTSESVSSGYLGESLVKGEYKEKEPHYGDTISQNAPVPQEAYPVDEAKSNNHIRTVTIEQVNYGYIVRVGCHTFAIETNEKVVTNLAKYMQNPSRMETIWFAKKEL